MRRYFPAVLLILCTLVFACGGGNSNNTPTISQDDPPEATETMPVTEAELQEAAKDAFIYGLPLVEMMDVCDQLPTVNRLQHRAALADPQSNNVIRPNNDTLYTSACLYLGADWVKVTMPPSPDRYQSMQVFDAYTETAAAIGPNQIPETGAEFILRYRETSLSPLPPGIAVIDVSTPYAFILFRTLVEGPDDLNAADQAQRLIQLETNSIGLLDRSSPSDSSPAQDFYLKLMRRLAQNPPSLLEQNLVDSFAITGIQASNNPSISDLNQAQLDAWERAYSEGLDQVNTTPINRRIGTWRFINPNAANPGNDYLLRAVVARHGIFPQTYDEAIYARTNGDGTAERVLQLPSNWQPVDDRGFWSLTMYNENGFLVSNPINRFSIGDRTPGLVFAADGSLRLYIQCTDPGSDLSANWLPAPCGPYTVTMRMYLPSESTRAPTFMLPPLM